MGQLLVIHETELCPVWRRGILTVPVEDAGVRCSCATGRYCPGVSVDDIPLAHRALQLHVTAMGERFISGIAKLGYTFSGQPLRLHGPFPSYDLNAHLSDAQSWAFKQAQIENDPNHVLGFVFEREAFNPYADYVFWGCFFRNEHRRRTSLPEVATVGSLEATAPAL